MRNIYRERHQWPICDISPIRKHTKLTIEEDIKDHRKHIFELVSQTHLKKFTLELFFLMEDPVYDDIFGFYSLFLNNMY